MPVPKSMCIRKNVRNSKVRVMERGRRRVDVRDVAETLGEVLNAVVSMVDVDRSAVASDSMF